MKIGLAGILLVTIAATVAGEFTSKDVGSQQSTNSNPISRKLRGIAGWFSGLRFQRPKATRTTVVYTGTLKYDDLGPPRASWYYPDGPSRPGVETIIPWTPEDLEREDLRRQFARACQREWECQELLSIEDLGPPRPTWYYPDGPDGPAVETLIPWTPKDLELENARRAFARSY